MSATIVSAASVRACIAAPSRSIAVTAKPGPASQRTGRPEPAATSRTLPPGAIRCAQRRSHGEAAAGGALIGPAVLEARPQAIGEVDRDLGSLVRGKAERQRQCRRGP